MSEDEYREFNEELARFEEEHGRLKTDNRNFYSVTVANEEDKERWIKLREEQLLLAQAEAYTQEERFEDEDRIKAINQELRKLKGKVAKEE